MPSLRKLWRPAEKNHQTPTASASTDIAGSVSTSLVLPADHMTASSSSSSLAVPVSQVQDSRFSVRRILARSNRSSISLASTPDPSPGPIHDDTPKDPTIAVEVDKNVTTICDDKSTSVTKNLTPPPAEIVAPAMQTMPTDAIQSTHPPSNEPELEAARPVPLVESNVAKITVAGPGLAHNPQALISTGPNTSAVQEIVVAPLNTIDVTLSPTAVNQSSDTQVQPLQMRRTIPSQLEGNRVIVVSQKLWETAFKNLEDPDREALSMHIESLHIPSGNIFVIDSLLQSVAQRKAEIDNKRGGMWTFTWKNKKFNMVKILDNIVSWADRFKAIGDVIAQYDPGHIALPWAAARFLLQIMTEDSANMAAITITVERVTNVSTICAIYAGMYLDDRILSAVCFSRLEATLIKLHGNIFSILARTVRYLKYKREVVRSLFQYDNFEDQLRRIDDILQELRDDVDIAERDIMNLNRQWQQDTYHRLKSLLHGLGGTLEKLERSAEALENDLQEKKRHDLLTWISACPSKRHHEDILVGQQIMENTGQWLFETHDFLDWIEQPESSVFWLNGNPGVGKSHLTYAAIELVHRTQNKVSAHFYCSRRDNDKARSDPEAIIRALLKGLLIGSGIDPAEISLEARYKQRSDQGELSLKEAQTFILNLLKEPQCDGAVLFIDALDEVDRNGRFQLLAAISEIVTSTAAKVWIASRLEVDIQLGLVKRIPQKAKRPGLVRDVAIAKRNEGEIRQYIEREIDSRIESGELLDGSVDDATKQAIIEKLSEKGDGMYLWVYLQILSLCSLTHTDYVREQLEKLPQGLDNTYRGIYDKIRTAASSPDRANAISVFKWLCATTPLKFSELSELVKHTNTTYKVHAPFIADEIYLRKICHNLVAIDYQQQDPEVRLVHLSVREFLESEQDFGLGGLPHEIAVKTCLDHLLTVPSSSSLMPYIVLNWTRHYRLAIDDGPGRLDQTSEIVALTNRFLQRAHQKWLRKLSDIDKGFSCDINPLFTIARHNLHELCQNVFRSPKSFNINPEIRTSTTKTPLHLAVMGGHLETVEWFITIGADFLDVNAQDEDGRTPLAVAIFLRNYDLIQLLLRTSRSAIDLNKEDKVGGFPPLVRAAWIGDEQIVQILLSATDTSPYSSITSNHIALNLNACDSLGRSAFHWGIMRQNSDIIRLLAEAGADVNAWDGVSKTHPLTRLAIGYTSSMGLYVNLCLDSHDHKPQASAISRATAALEHELNVFRQLCQIPEIDLHVSDIQGFTPIGHLLYHLHTQHQRFNESGLGGGLAMEYERYKKLSLDILEILLSTNSFDVNSTMITRGFTVLPIIWAITYGLEDVVELFLDHEPRNPALRLNINAIGFDPEPATALGVAVSNNNINLVKLLLRSRFCVDLRIPDLDGKTALQIAVENGSRDIVEVLLQAEGLTHEGEPGLLMGETWTRLSQAASHSHEAILEVYNPGYVGVQDRSDIDYQALYRQLQEKYNLIWNVIRAVWNAANDDTSAQQQLLSLDINTTNSTGSTALHYIFFSRDFSTLECSPNIDVAWGQRNYEIKRKILRILLATPGLDGNVIDNGGFTPLGRSILYTGTQSQELLYMLLDATEVVDVNYGSETGHSPLFLAGVSNPEVAEQWKMLVADKRVNLNVFSPYGVVLLASFTHKPTEIDLFETLLKSGRVQPNLQSKSTGRPALSQAVLYSNYAAVKMLLKYPGIDIEIPDQSLDTPLTIAAQVGDVKIVKALLRMKPNLSWRNYRGLTPMEIAVEEGHIKIVELMNAALDGDTTSFLDDDSDIDPSKNVKINPVAGGNQE